MKPDGSVSFSQKSATVSYLERVQSSPRLHNVRPSDSFRFYPGK
jgi:hypothetical protein